MITRNDIYLATGADLDRMMGELRRRGKSDEIFRYDVLEAFRMAHIIDPETFQVNHPLGIGQRVSFDAMRKGRISGISALAQYDPKGDIIYRYTVRLDDGNTCELDHYWVWPLDDRDMLMQARREE